MHILEVSIITINKYSNNVSSSNNAFYRTCFKGPPYILEFIERSCQFPPPPDTRFFFLVWHESSDRWPLWVQQWIVDCSDKWCPSRIPRYKNLRVSDRVNILFILHFEPPAHHQTFVHVSWCEFMLDLDFVWVQLNILP